MGKREVGKWKAETPVGWRTIGTTMGRTSKAGHHRLHKHFFGSLKVDGDVRNLFLRLLISVDGLSPMLWAPNAITGVDQGFPRVTPGFTQTPTFVG
jgi:hypothetical protein